MPAPWYARWIEILEGRVQPSVMEQTLLAIMTPFAGLHQLVQRTRSHCYEQACLPTFRADCPVISVGNLSIGGTGKTPTVLWLARYLSALGITIAIVSRGYKQRRSVNEVTLVADPTGIRLTPPEAADESYLLACHLPGIAVVTCAHRQQAIQFVLERFPVDGILLDDGFQHRAVQRDLDLVLLDAHAPLGNGKIFPAGILREPPAALQRADAFLFTRAEQPQNISPLLAPFIGEKPVMAARHRPQFWMDLQHSLFPLETLFGQPVLAFCGIAKPHLFQEQLQKMGVEIAQFVVFRDHHPFSITEVEHLVQQSKTVGATTLICTEKELVKISALPHHGKAWLPLYALTIELEFLEPPVWLMENLQRLFGDKRQNKEQNKIDPSQ